MCVCEAAAAIIAEDARLVIVAESAKLAVDEELEFVAAISEFTWQRCVFIIGDTNITWRELRGFTIECSYVAAAFMHKRMFSILSELPWSLAKGCPATNSMALVEKDARRDPTCSLKILKLRAPGYSMVQLVTAVGLLPEIVWGTIPVEQGHGSLGFLHVYHPWACAGILCVAGCCARCELCFLASS